MRLYGLIGFPLSHSFSRSYFADKFKEQRIADCAYENFPLESIDQLPSLLDSHIALQGLNVTIPYKETVIPFLDDYSELVAQTGACNCIRIHDHRLSGHNTDVMAFERSLLAKKKAEQAKALVLGSGGAAKAVRFVLERNHIEFTNVSRQPGVDRLGYSQLTPEIIREHLLIINTTPLGMFPHEQEFPPLRYDAISKKHFLFDLIYNPARTQFLARGEERGASIQNGYEMLVLQAEESWKIWNS
jgi:shikimate dehydrogenase